MQRRESISGLGAALALGAFGPQVAAGEPDTRLAGNGFVTLRPREDAAVRKIALVCSTRLETKSIRRAPKPRACRRRSTTALGTVMDCW